LQNTSTIWGDLKSCANFSRFGLSLYDRDAMARSAEKQRRCNSADTGTNNQAVVSTHA
jgi:hypothetical protein